MPDLVTPDTEVGLYWLENDGQGNFTRHIIHERSPEWLERHEIADINGDGRPEIVFIDNINGCLLYFEYEGDPRLPSSWRTRYVDEGTLTGAYDVAVADFNGNGDLDVAASTWRKGNQFVWYENRDGHWIKHIIEDNIAETRTIHAADIDGDGKIDLLGTARVGNQVIWYENPGDPVNQPWIKHIIDDAPQPSHGHPVDMDGDGDLDVVMALGMLPPPMTPPASPSSITRSSGTKTTATPPPASGASTSSVNASPTPSKPSPPTSTVTAISKSSPPPGAKPAASPTSSTAATPAVLGTCSSSKTAGPTPTWSSPPTSTATAASTSSPPPNAAATKSAGGATRAHDLITRPTFPPTDAKPARSLTANRPHRPCRPRSCPSLHPITLHDRGY